MTEVTFIDGPAPMVIETATLTIVSASKAANPDYS